MSVADVVETRCISQTCRARIRKVLTVSGATMPVDWAPADDGTLVLTQTPQGWRIRVVKADEQPWPGDDPRGLRWVSHFATCPAADEHRAGLRAAPALEAPSGPGVLLAVDGNSLAHRAFHGYERTGMRTPEGRPLWAVFGFLKLLTGIIDMTSPDAVVVGFDDRAGSVRRERFEAYKAGRSAKSEDLYLQMDDIVAVLAELGVHTITPAGLEADDVLASAAAAAERAGWTCTIATSDKDAFGLISDATTVLRLANGLDRAERITSGRLFDLYGVSSAQWRDYVALVGDKSDNLPGPDGIGPKTAVKLLSACGTLDAALEDPAAAVAAIGKAAAGKLAGEPARAVIARNRDIMAPVRDLQVDLEACRLRRQPVGYSVGKVLRARHMPSLIDRTVAALTPSLEQNQAATAPAAPPAPPPAVVADGPVYPYTCPSPRHGGAKVPARKYAGGIFCDDCNTRRFRHG